MANTTAVRSDPLNTWKANVPREAFPETCRNGCRLGLRNHRLGATFAHRTSAGSDFFPIDHDMLNNQDLDIWPLITAWIADLHVGDANR